jgi:hypothetical protein
MVVMALVTVAVWRAVTEKRAPARDRWLRLPSAFIERDSPS